MPNGLAAIQEQHPKVITKRTAAVVGEDDIHPPPITDSGILAQMALAMKIRKMLKSQLMLKTSQMKEMLMIQEQGKG